MGMTPQRIVAVATALEQLTYDEMCVLANNVKAYLPQSKPPTRLDACDALSKAAAKILKKDKTDAT